MSKHIRRRQNKRQKEVARLKARLATEQGKSSKYLGNFIQLCVEQGNIKMYYHKLAVRYLRAFESVCEIAGENPCFVVPEYETDAKNLSPTDENGNYK